MFQYSKFHIPALVWIYLLAVTASPCATILLPIVSGTIVFPPPPPAFGSGMTQFNLVTPAGTVTGSTPASVPDVMRGFPSTPNFSVQVDPSLGTLGGNTFTGPASFTLMLPGPIHIYDDGVCCDGVFGTFTASPFILTRGGPMTFVSIFSGQLLLRDFDPVAHTLLNDYFLPGSGTVTVTFHETASSVQFDSATYTFGTVPEPSTTVLCLLAGLGGVALIRRRK